MKASDKAKRAKSLSVSTTLSQFCSVTLCQLKGYKQKRAPAFEDLEYKVSVYERLLVVIPIFIGSFLPHGYPAEDTLMNDKNPVGIIVFLSWYTVIL